MVQDLVPAPVAFDLLRISIDPDRRAASSHHNLRAQVLLLPVHVVTYVVRTFHPVAGCLLPGFLILRSDELWIRVCDAVSNVLAHPAKLLFACLAFFNRAHLRPPPKKYKLLLRISCSMLPGIVPASHETLHSYYFCPYYFPFVACGLASRWQVAREWKAFPCQSWGAKCPRPLQIKDLTPGRSLLNARRTG